MPPSLYRRLRQAWSAFCAPVPDDRSPYPATPGYLRSRAVIPASSSFEHRTVVFEMETVARASGGIADILALGQELAASHGFKVFYHVQRMNTGESAWEELRWIAPDLKPEQVLTNLDFVPEFLFATTWPTAYDIQTIPAHRRLYFAQDYEPWFNTAGVRRHYASASYELGHEIITLGPWIAKHLAEVQGVQATPMPFPVTDEPGQGDGPSERDTVAVFIQPEKAHRGTDLLVAAMREMAEDLKRQGLKLVLFGSSQNEWLSVDFPCELRGLLSREELRALFLRTRLGVCASFTNISLITPRFLMHGAPVCDLDLPNVRLNLPEAARDYIHLYPPHVEGLIDTIRRALARPLPEQSVSTLASAIDETHGWPACTQVVARVLKGSVV